MTLRKGKEKPDLRFAYGCQHWLSHASLRSVQVKQDLPLSVRMIKKKREVQQRVLNKSLEQGLNLSRS